MVTAISSICGIIARNIVNNVMNRPGIATHPAPSQLFELAAVAACLPKELIKPEESREFAAAQFMGRLVTPKYTRRRHWEMWLVEQGLNEEDDTVDIAQTTYHFSWDTSSVTHACRKVIVSYEEEDEYDILPTQEKSFGSLWLNAVHQMATVSRADCSQLIKAVKHQFKLPAQNQK